MCSSDLHNIAINGNLRTGTATLKSALNLYIQFYNEKYHPESVDSTPFKILFNRIMEIVNEFAKQEKSKRKESYNKKEVVTERLQKPLLNLLQKEISGVEWESEHVYRKETKDRIPPKRVLLPAFLLSHRPTKILCTIGVLYGKRITLS